MNRPPSGSMVYWRFVKKGGAWLFGYVTYAGGCDMLRMGQWHGDTVGGCIVSAGDIEWRKYK